MKNLIFLLIISCGMLCCKEKANPGADSGHPTSAVSTVNPDFQNLYPINADSIYHLYTHVDFIDFIFYDLPVSISANDVNSLKRHIQAIDDVKPVSIDRCALIGRMFVHVKGQIIAEADIYVEPTKCYYFVFHTNDKPSYVNGMTMTGRMFFDGLLQRYRKS